MVTAEVPPSLIRPTALNCCDVPDHSETVFGVMLTPVRVGAG
jgi:hypothetical protein